MLLALYATELACIPTGLIVTFGGDDLDEFKFYTMDRCLDYMVIPLFLIQLGLRDHMFQKLLWTFIY